MNYDKTNSPYAVDCGRSRWFQRSSAQGQLQKTAINFPTRSGASWPMFIAKEGGYYQKYGLDVNLVFGAGTLGVAMISSGEAAMTNSSMEQAMQAAFERSECAGDDGQHAE